MYIKLFYMKLFLVTLFLNFTHMVKLYLDYFQISFAYVT